MSISIPSDRPWTRGPWRFDRENDNEGGFEPRGTGGSICTGEEPRIGWVLARVWHVGVVVAQKQEVTR